MSAGKGTKHFSLSGANGPSNHIMHPISEIRPALTAEETQHVTNTNPPGISLREYLAGQALAGMLANSFNATVFTPFEEYAVDFADKTIAQLNRTKQ